MKLTDKKSWILLFLCILLVGFMMVFIDIDANICDAAVATPLYRVKFNYSHYYVLNTDETLVASINNVDSCSLKYSETGNASLYFEMYGDSYSGNATLENGGFINSSTVHIMANSGWGSNQTLMLLNSKGEEVASSKSSITKTLADGEYMVAYQATGNGWLINQREYAHYRVAASFTFKVDTTSPTILGASVDTSYVSKATTISSSDSYSGIKALYVKTPSSKNYITTSNPYNILESSENGLYSFYAVDVAGNTSPTHYTFLDTTKPVVSFYSNGVKVNGDYVKGPVTIKGEDNGEIDSIYFSLNGGEFTKYSGTIESAGRIEAYAVDKLGNESDIIAVVLDNIKPVGKVYTSYGEASTGALVTSSNGMRYEATDSGSGIDKMYYKVEGTSYKEYKGEYILEDGSYYFYAVDKANNQSPTFLITLDSTKPTCTLYQNESVLNLEYSSASYIKFYAQDLNGIDSLYYIKDGVKVNYSQLSQIKDEGTYTFYAVDKASNISDAYTVTIDRSAPEITLFGDGNEIECFIYNVEYIEAKAFDSFSPIQNIFVSRNKVDYVVYKEGTKLLDVGNYYFKAIDMAGNGSSIYDVTIDREKPIVYFAQNDKANYGNTSSSNIIFQTEDNVGVADLYYKNSLMGEYVQYGFDELSDGNYYFYAVDYAQNSSDVLNVIVDSKPPVVKVLAGDTDITNLDATKSSIRFVVSDDNETTSYVLIPGEKNYIEYVNGSILQGEGRYRFYAVDLVGNKSDEIEIVIDKSCPDYDIKNIDGNELKNGDVTSQDFTFNSIDNYCSSFMYVKMPSTSSFRVYNGEILSAEGTYFFYAEDILLNATNEIKITLDKTAPIGKILIENEDENLLYTNKKFIRYEASDSLSQIAKMYVKENGNLREYFGEKLVDEGEYIFTSFDEANNSSDEVSIIIDRTSPIAEFDNINVNGYYNDSFKYIAKDDVKLSKCYIKTPNCESYEEYTNGSLVENLVDGTYSFYAVDMAGNASNVSVINMDITSPTGSIIVDGSPCNLEYSNSDFSFNSLDGFYLFIKYPGANNFIEYDGQIIPSYSSIGEYQFKCQDLAFNESEIYSIFLDNDLPFGAIISNYSMLNNNEFVSHSIHFEAQENTSKIKAMYMVKNGIVSEYFGEEICEDGSYSFYAEDLASNKSILLTCTIDTILPTYKIYKDNEETLNNHINSDRFYLEFYDLNLDKAYILLPDSTSYVEYNSGTIYSKEGIYSFYVEDKAKNKVDYINIYVDRTPKEVVVKNLVDGYAENDVYITWENNGLSKITNVTVNSKHYSRNSIIHIINDGKYDIEAIDEAGNVFRTSFMSKKNVLGIKTPIYKWYEVKNEDDDVYSFDSYEKAKGYATSSNLEISEVYFYEKTPAKEYPSNNVYENFYISSYIKVDKNTLTLIDGKIVQDSIYQEEGVHSVIIKDDYYNEYETTFIVSLNKADVLSVSDSNKPLNEDEYYLTKDITVSIDDIDPHAMLIVKDKNGKEITRLSKGENYTLEDGKYLLYTINHFGQGKTKTICISLSLPSISFNELNNNKKLEIEIIKSQDEVAKISNISIFKKIEDEYVKLEKDDYNTIISKGTTTYYFRTSFEYKVSVEDNFRFNQDRIESTYKFSKAAPDIEITNIDNYYTNKDVEVSFIDEAYVELYKNGSLISFTQGKIKAEGKYTLYFKDYDGYNKTFEFEIDKTVPNITLNGVNKNLKTNSNVKIESNEEVELVLFKDEKEINYLIGSEISEDGSYFYKAKDRSGNETSGEFIIDSKVDFSFNTLNGAISSQDVVINKNEDLTISILKDNVSYPYEFGEKLSSEGNYVAKIEDSVGNERTIDFKIVKSKQKSFELSLKHDLLISSIQEDSKPYSSHISTPFIFNKDGVYEITLTNGIEDTSFTVIIDTLAPIVELDGVLNGGKTKGKVKVKSISEDCEIKLYLNGHQTPYKDQMEFKDQGVYTIYFTDEVGNETQVSFEIIQGINKGIILLILFLIILVIIILILFFIFKKKNKKIKELELKKDPIEQEEDRHFVEPVMPIEPVIEISKDEENEIKERDEALSILHQKEEKVEEVKNDAKCNNKGFKYTKKEDKDIDNENINNLSNIEINVEDDINNKEEEIINTNQTEVITPYSSYYYDEAKGVELGKKRTTRNDDINLYRSKIKEKFDDIKVENIKYNSFVNIIEYYDLKKNLRGGKITW